MKKLHVLILFLGLCGYVHAQETEKASFSIGPEMALPSQSAYVFGYGASAKVEIAAVRRFSVTLTGGYSIMKYRSALIGAFGPQPAGRFVPLKAGLRYGSGGGLFLEAEGGNVIELTGNKANLFTFSLGPGFRFPISPKQAIELGFRYEKWSKNVLTQTGIRVAYRLGW